MPYIYDPNLDPEKENQTSQVSSGVQLSGASPVAAPSGSTAPNPQSAKSGSGFQNLDKYLSMNQAQNFGGQVLGKVSDQIQGAGAQMSSAADQFKSQVGAANALPSTEDVNKAIANPGGADAKQFQTWENQSYAGPKSLSENQDVWNKYWSGTKQAQTSAGLLGNEAGRFTLLDQYFGKPTYNYGQKSLDNLLMQQSGLGKQTQDLQNQATQLQATGTQKAQELSDVAATRVGEVDKNRAQVRSAIGLDAQGNVIQGTGAGALGKQWADVQAQLDAANAARAADTARLQQGLSQNALSGADLNALGLTAGQNTYGVDLSKYFTAGPQLTRDQVMQDPQRNYIQALSQLAGVTDTFASGTKSAANPEYNYNTAGLQSDIKGAQGLYESALRNTPVTFNWGGAQKSDTLQNLEQQLDEARGQLGGNDDAHFRAVVSTLTPVVEQAKQKIAQQYNVGSTIKQYGQTPDAAAITTRRPTVFGSVG